MSHPNLGYLAIRKCRWHLTIDGRQDAPRKPSSWVTTPHRGETAPQRTPEYPRLKERKMPLSGPFRWPQLDFGSPKLYIRIVLHLCYLCSRVSEFVLPPISDDKLISFGGWRNVSPRKLVLGVQSRVNELCSICAICATGFQNLCYLLSVTISLSVSGRLAKC